MAQFKRHHLVSSFLVLTGALFGVASVMLYKENHPKRPDRVLKQAKALFAQQGQIEGSWIHYEPIEYTALESQPLVYIGGVTRLEQGHAVYYQFACDIYTGEVLDILEIT